MDFEKRKLVKPKDESKIIDESMYVDLCVNYALNTGWVQPEQKNILTEQYLKPIYKKYTEVLDEVKSEVAADTDAETRIKIITKRLGHILERTRRIGSTDRNNITREIYDYRDSFCQSDEYLEYAATSLADFISELLYSKS
ncbi:hypothetical protein A2480_00925 [Candidatus Uhrbacteria bacterium RIFOXYC2_FULL_47_19]|uniref:Uncharacterized protein n=1 Tax=Candidatus Uhrbacteria bacterium RIFOXYC2_FULL_47_19 TaxID=1802424 RepID=A0A1F7WEN4_9BACT|nr:MAG: hypothetical protein A2480_00925 [Candidatus Uhrbacteria bacterium RIFOXYC2_FULL_47_19]